MNNNENINTREYIENLESKILSSFASFSFKSKGRLKKENYNNPLKTIFMEDRDRIVKSEGFRRLKQKTQVFLSPSNDLYRTRLTHSLEVSVVARTISRKLKLNEDLTEAIALSHDLGHPPFGHAGEQILNECSSSGFRHTKQSLRVVDVLENNGKGLNLSFEVRDGIAKHSKSMGSIIPDIKKMPSTLEGQVVRIADRMTYLIHDFDDAVRSEILSLDDIPASIKSSIGDLNQDSLDAMIFSVSVGDCYDVNSKIIIMQENISLACDSLKDFLFDRVYYNKKVLEQANRAKEIIRRLYDFFSDNPDIIFDKTIDIGYADGDVEQRIVDYIAMMTDSFAIRLYDKYISPKKWFTASQLE